MLLVFHNSVDCFALLVSGLHVFQEVGVGGGAQFRCELASEAMEGAVMNGLSLLRQWPRAKGDGCCCSCNKHLL